MKLKEIFLNNFEVVIALSQGNKSMTKIAKGVMTMPSLSEKLKKWEERGLVTSTRKGRELFYSLTDKGRAGLTKMFEFKNSSAIDFL